MIEEDSGSGRRNPATGKENVGLGGRRARDLGEFISSLQIYMEKIEQKRRRLRTMSEETNEKLDKIIELLQRIVKWLDDIESKLSEIEGNTAD